MARKVHIATPTTLVTMLRTAQYAWQQAALADNARAVFDLGRELYDRHRPGSAGTWTSLGRALTKRCPPITRRSARWKAGSWSAPGKLNELGVVEGELGPPTPVRRRPARCRRRSWWPGRPGEIATGTGTRQEPPRR